jgi:uncharacterized protein YfaS (alpha-2-macroglobulin family)
MPETSVRNVGLKFRLSTAKQRWTTYAQHWARIVRQIEEGTFKRDRDKAEKRFGAPSIPRQGGDSLGGEGLTVVPTKTVALFSGLVRVGRDGKALVPLALPDFNGELRLMAVAWSESAVGAASQAATVRDPVVAELTLPRFLAPGDTADATLELSNVEGPAGAYRVTVSPSGAVSGQTYSQSFQLAAKAQWAAWRVRQH